MTSKKIPPGCDIIIIAGRRKDELEREKSCIRLILYKNEYVYMREVIMVGRKNKNARKTVKAKKIHVNKYMVFRDITVETVATAVNPKNQRLK